MSRVHESLERHADPSVWNLVRSLRRKELPRNRHFDAHESAAAVRARRLHKFLRGVERDLRHASEVRVLRDERAAPDGGPRVRRVVLEFAAVRLRRTVSLPDEAWGILVEDPELAARLGA